MARPLGKPVLIRRVHLWWYPVALVPILALFYLGFTGVLPVLVGMLALFALFFWFFSFCFALFTVLRRRPPPDLRQ